MRSLRSSGTLPPLLAGCAVSLLALLAIAPAAAAPAESPQLALPKPLPLPHAAGEVDLDDMQFDAALDRVLVPTAGVGDLDLVDPANDALTSIPVAAGGSPAQVTSAASAPGLLFTADRATQRLLALDARTYRILASAPLASGADYVRYLPERKELWVTEPRAAAIQVFELAEGKVAALRPVISIPVAGGPEALAVDAARGRAYTNLWQRETLAIDLATREIVAHWSSGCEAPRGLALDAPHGLLFIGCKDGTVTALGVGGEGEVLSTLRPGDGTDIIAFDAGRRHLYVPGAKSATLAIVAASTKGALTLLGSAPAAAHSHCVTTDGKGGIYVCDPAHGRLLVYRDPFVANE